MILFKFLFILCFGCGSWLILIFFNDWMNKNSMVNVLEFLKHLNSKFIRLWPFRFIYFVGCRFQANCTLTNHIQWSLISSQGHIYWFLFTIPMQLQLLLLFSFVHILPSFNIRFLLNYTSHFKMHALTNCLCRILCDMCANIFAMFLFHLWNSWEKEIKIEMLRRNI